MFTRKVIRRGTGPSGGHTLRSRRTQDPVSGLSLTGGPKGEVVPKTGSTPLAPIASGKSTVERVLDESMDLDGTDSEGEGSRWT